MSTYDFGSGRTDPGSFPTEALAEAASVAVRELGAELVRYPGDMGHQGLREVMAMRESQARRRGRIRRSHRADERLYAGGHADSRGADGRSGGMWSSPRS